MFIFYLTSVRLLHRLHDLEIYKVYISLYIDGVPCTNQFNKISVLFYSVLYSFTRTAQNYLNYTLHRYKHWAGICIICSRNLIMLQIIDIHLIGSKHLHYIV